MVAVASGSRLRGLRSAPAAAAPQENGEFVVKQILSSPPLVLMTTDCGGVRALCIPGSFCSLREPLPFRWTREVCPGAAASPAPAEEDEASVGALAEVMMPSQR